jgi:hypothetical protein
MQKCCALTLSVAAAVLAVYAKVIKAANIRID